MKKLPKWIDDAIQKQLGDGLVPLLKKNKALQLKVDSLSSKYKNLKKKCGKSELEFADFVKDNKYGFKDFLRLDESEKPEPRAPEDIPGSLQWRHFLSTGEFKPRIFFVGRDK